MKVRLKLKLMSFVSIFKSIGKGLESVATIGSQVATVVTVFNPAAGAILAAASTAILKAELLFSGTPKSGVQKKQAVMDELMSGLTLAFAMNGKTMPANVQQDLSTAVDNIVSVLNSVNSIQQTAATSNG